jgi:WS/DGAT/MGAT family acyltransferase
MSGYYERLSATDRLFLDLDQPTTPQHIAAITLFDAAPLRESDGALALARVREWLAARLHLVPRLRQRLAFVPHEHHPVWVDAEHFRLDDHLREAAVPRPGNERQLKELIGRILVEPLERERPLWQITLIDGLAGGEHVALVIKAHHCMADGLGGFDLLGLLLAPTPDPGIPPTPAWEPRPAPDPDELLRLEMARRADRLLDALRELPRALEERDAWLAKLVDGAAAVGEAVGIALSSAAETPFNHPLGHERLYEWRTLELERVRTLRKALGGTLNDVVLACVAGGVRRLLASRRLDPDVVPIRASVPVNVRTAAAGGGAGNQVALMVVDLPVGVADPRDRFASASAAAAQAKESRQVEGSKLLAALAEWTTGAVLSLAARAAARGRPYNLVITNVPGPQQPLYLLGARMRALHPAVNLVEGQGLGAAIASYAGELSFGFLADRALVPDLATFADAVIESFLELEATAGTSRRS